MKKHIIWSSTINFEDWEDDLKENILTSVKINFTI